MTDVALLTGAGGFLAGYAARAFGAAGWSCVGIGRSDPNGQARLYASFHLSDLEDSDRVAALLERYQPAVVLHFAGPASVASSVSRPQADLRNHITPIGNVLEAIRLAGSGTRFLLVSSAAVYGNPRSLPVAEDAPARPVSPYGFHKLMQETLTDEYHSVFGIPAVKARLFSTFGEGLRRLAVWDIARRALGGDCTVHGTGEEIRDYLHAQTVGEALLTIAANASFGGEAINVASGRGTTVRQLAERIFETLGINEHPRFSGVAPREKPTAWVADVGRLASLGFRIADDQEALLRRTIEWIRQG